MAYIVKYPAEVLTTHSEPVTDFDGYLADFVDAMFRTMYAAHGVGLAAPQIGISKRIAVIDTTCGKDWSARLVLINPAIIRAEGRQRGREGCLSLPSFSEDVTRPSSVTVRAQNTNGEWFETVGEGLLARAIMHEVDHLKGQLFIVHLSKLKRDMIKRKARKLAESKTGE